MSRRPPNDEGYDQAYSNAAQPYQYSAPYAAHPFMPAPQAQVGFQAAALPRSGVIEPLSTQVFAQQPFAQQPFTQQTFNQPAFQQPAFQQPAFQQQQQPHMQQSFIPQQQPGIQPSSFQQPYSPYVLPKAQNLPTLGNAYSNAYSNAYTPAITFATSQGPVSLTSHDFIDLRDGIQVDCGDGVHIQKSGNGIKKIHKSKKVMGTEMEAKKLLKEASDKDIDDMVASNLKDLNLGKKLHPHPKAVEPVQTLKQAPKAVPKQAPKPNPDNLLQRSSEVGKQIAELQRSINNMASCKASSRKKISGLARDSRVNIVSVA